MSNQTTPTIEEILRDAAAARAELENSEKELDLQIKAIDAKSEKTPEDKTAREKLRNAQKAVRNAQVEQVFKTLQSLDQSTEVKQLIASFKSVNDALRQAAQEVQDVKKKADSAVKAIASIEKVAQKLAKFIA